MQGTVIIIRSYQKLTPPPEMIFTKPIHVDILQAIVGGWIELVPGFDTISYNGEIIRCVAFCNEDGKLKKLPFNGTATLLWHRALRLRNPHGQSYFEDYLAGDVAVVIGDDEFVAAL